MAAEAGGKEPEEVVTGTRAAPWYGGTGAPPPM